jgi:hypothetical protein
VASHGFVQANLQAFVNRMDAIAESPPHLMENLWIAIVVACTTLITSTIAPVAVGYFSYSTRKRERIADWARQDEVARRVAQVAQNQSTQAKITSAEIARNSDKLDVVHSLVNSQLQAALQAEHDALVVQLTLMNEIMAMRSGKGTGPTEEALAAIKKVEARIAELESIIRERRQIKVKGGSCQTRDVSQ